MFTLMPAAKDTRRRHSKRPPTSKKNPPPPSTVSSSSASSNKTVTSRSIFPSSLRPSKRPDATPIASERPPTDHGRSRSTNDAGRPGLDVFAFMEEEEDEEFSQDTGIETAEVDEQEDLASSSLSSAAASTIDRPQRSPRYSDLEVRTIHEGVQRVWARESLHSDSGISDMRSNSPDQESPVLPKKLPTLPDEPWGEVNGRNAHSYTGTYEIQTSPHASGDRSPALRRKHWSSLETNHAQHPEPYGTPSPPRFIDDAHSSMPELHPRPTNQLVRGTSGEIATRGNPNRSGYELLASKIDSHGDAVLKPIYRKFETLNNRMLLYLQDEICEMEDQLRELDEAIAHEEQSCEEKRASRRAEAKLPSQLQWHRLDLLNRCFAKVEQYNRALTSYSNLTKSLDRASYTDINAYRSWISEHTPTDEQESAFLQQDTDLLGISPRPGIRTSPRTGTAFETPIVLIAFAFLSTVVVFKVVPQILGRLVISAMVGVASLCTLSPEVTTNLTCVRDWGRAITTYSIIMVVLAIVVS